MFRSVELRLKCLQDFLLLCGDVIFDIDFNRFIEFHKSKKALATLLSHPNGHPYDSSLLVTETLPPKEKGANPVETNKVVSWLSKEDERKYYRNLVNAGLEIISPELLRLTMKNFVPRHHVPARIAKAFYADCLHPQTEFPLSRQESFAQHLAHPQPCQQSHHCP